MKLRILFSAVLVIALALPVITIAIGFPDVDDDHQYADAIRWASNLEEFNGNPLFRGFPDGDFRPDRELTDDQFLKVVDRLFDSADAWTRAETAALLYHGFKGIRPTTTTTTTITTTSRFPDVDDDHQYADAIRWASNLEEFNGNPLFRGFPDGDFRPDRELTDDQFLKVVDRLFDSADAWTRAETAALLYHGFKGIRPTTTTTTTIQPQNPDPLLQVGIWHDDDTNYRIRWVRPGWESQGWKWRLHSYDPNCDFTNGVGNWQVREGWSNFLFDERGLCIQWGIEKFSAGRWQSGTYDWQIEIVWDNGERFISEPCVRRNNRWDCNTPNWNNWPLYIQPQNTDTQLQVGIAHDEEGYWRFLWIRPGWESQGWKWRLHSYEPNCPWNDIGVRFRGVSGWQTRPAGTYGKANDGGLCIEEGTYDWQIEIVWDNGERFISEPCVRRNNRWDCPIPDDWNPNNWPNPREYQETTTTFVTTTTLPYLNRQQIPAYYQQQLDDWQTESDRIDNRLKSIEQNLRALGHNILEHDPDNLINQIRNSLKEANNNERWIFINYIDGRTVRMTLPWADRLWNKWRHAVVEARNQRDLAQWELRFKYKAQILIPVVSIDTEFYSESNGITSFDIIFTTETNETLGMVICKTLRRRVNLIGGADNRVRVHCPSGSDPSLYVFTDYYSKGRTDDLRVIYDYIPIPTGTNTQLNVPKLNPQIRIIEDNQNPNRVVVEVIVGNSDLARSSTATGSTYPVTYDSKYTRAGRTHRNSNGSLLFENMEFDDDRFRLGLYKSVLQEIDSGTIQLNEPGAPTHHLTYNSQMIVQPDTTESEPS